MSDKSVMAQLGLEEYLSMFVGIGYVGAGVIALIILAGISFYIYHYRQTYPYKVRLRSLRSNGNYKERNVKGGMIKARSGVYFFRIRLSMKPRDFFDLYNTPNFNEVDTNDRIVYERIGHNRFIQLRVKQRPRFVLVDKVTGNVIEKEEEVNRIMTQFPEGELYEQYHVQDLYYQPLDEEKKSMALARLTLDVDNPLKEQESKLKAWIPIIIIALIGVFALAIVYTLLTNPVPCSPVACIP